MKDLIISLAADGRENYSTKVLGLERSIADPDNRWRGDVRIYKYFPSWCTPHDQVPYAFKYDLIQDALEAGYRRIFWLDSSMRLLGDIAPLLDAAEFGIVAFHNVGHDLEHYINDTAIKNLGITDLKGVKQTWGGALFFDFNDSCAAHLFKQVKKQIHLGSFNDDQTNRPGFIAHRHDQAVISYLLHHFDVPLVPYGIIAAKKDVTNKTLIQYGD